MAKKAQGDKTNKSAAIRELLTQNPEMVVKDVVSTLGEKGLKITPNLVYFIKGKLKEKAGRRRKVERQVANVAAATGSTGDVLGTIRKVKSMANDVGGLRKLMALVEALAE